MAVTDTPSPGATPAPAPVGPPDAAGVINQYAAAGGTSSTSKPSNAWMNYGPLSRPQSEYRHGTAALAPVGPDQFGLQPVADASREYYAWSDSQKQKFRSTLGLVNKSALTAPDDTIAAAWADYVQQSANYFAGGTEATPWDILAKDVASKSGPLASLAGTKTQTTSDTTLTNRLDSDAIFKSAAQSLLGRAPTSNESAQFQQLLNAQEAANPTQASITTTTDAEGNASSSQRTTTGGVSSAAAALLAQQQANKSPEAGAYQASTTYMNALLGLVRQGPI